MKRLHRTAAALLAAFALVFAQLAVSAHACGVAADSGQGEWLAHAEGCPGATQNDDLGENLCEQHCLYGTASIVSGTSVAMALPSADNPLKVELSCDLGGTTALQWRRIIALATPPAAILFGVLRI